MAIVEIDPVELEPPVALVTVPNGREVTVEVGPSSRFVELADRWEAAPGRWISVYLARER